MSPRQPPLTKQMRELLLAMHGGERVVFQPYRGSFSARYFYLPSSMKKVTVAADGLMFRSLINFVGKPFDPDVELTALGRGIAAQLVLRDQDAES